MIKNQDLPLNFKFQAGFALFSGILLAISFTSLSFDWLAWFALIPLFYSFYGFKLTATRGFFLSLIFSLSFYLGTLNWMFRLHPLTWLGFSEQESLLIISAGWFTFSLIEALGLSFLGFFLGKLNPVDHWQKVLFPVSLWLIIEWFQSLGPFGFTWGRLANSQFQNLSLIQSAGVFGSLFISGMIVAVNVSLTLLLIDFTAKAKIAKKVPATIFSILLLNFLYGLFSLNLGQDSEKNIKVSIIQGNILSDQKWDLSLQDTVNTYLDLSYQASLVNSESKPEIVVWPETAIPALLSNQMVLADLKRFTEITNTYLLTGIFTEKNNDFFNSIAAISPDGKILGTYSKQHLVPFGEYLPFRKLLNLLMPKLAQINALKKDVSAGENSAIINTPNGKIGGIVCYESIFPQITRSSVLAGAELLVMVTNDSWYKDSIGVYQHNSQAVFRAIESGRYLVRAANTGISSIILPTGIIQTQLGPLIKGSISADVKFLKKKNIYSFIGDSIIIIPFLYFFFIFYSRKMLSDE